MKFILLIEIHSREARRNFCILLYLEQQLQRLFHQSLRNFQNNNKKCCRKSLKMPKYRRIPHNFSSGIFRYSIPHNYRIKIFQVPDYRRMWSPCLMLLNHQFCIQFQMIIFLIMLSSFEENILTIFHYLLRAIKLFGIKVG